MYENSGSFTSVDNSSRDLTVSEILEKYKHDTCLLKCILAAKSEEDRRKRAEETRKTEETILQSKLIDLQLDQNWLDDTNSLGFSSSDWLPCHDLPSPFINNTPPSPVALFDPFVNLKISQPPLPIPAPKKENVSCKRTFSRTKSTRKPSIKTQIKKNRSSQIHSKENPTSPQTESTENLIEILKETHIKEPEKKEKRQDKRETSTLTHNKVIEALRAKLQRSTQQPKQEKISPVAMSPSGVLLLDLKNPKKVFPLQNSRALLNK
ncbi:hypothetical protein BY458DRAFT_489257 [Sporodiniella umbellata]|nr:hypothetical protein BY458DRAFT_489257 [Sporodiniella umbellata]